MDSYAKLTKLDLTDAEYVANMLQNML